MRNKGYNNYYKKPEAPVNEKKIEEVQNTEETVEVVQEETPVETPETETVEAEPIKQYAVVTGARRVNMRSQPTKESTVLAVLNEGTRVEILSSENPDWINIAFGNVNGYMMAQFLRPEN